MSSSRHYKIVGVGGTGSWLVNALSGMLEFHSPDSIMTLVDGDSFEEKNGERQLFDHSGNKAQSVAKSLRTKCDRVTIQHLAAWIVSPENAVTPSEEDDGTDTVARITAAELLDEGDVVILCVDNYAARQLVFEAAGKLNNIDVFSGGNGDVKSGDALFGTLYHYFRRDGIDITAPPADYHAEFKNPTDRNPGEMSCAERAKLDGGAQLVSANMTVAAIIMAKISDTILSENSDRQWLVDHAEYYFDWHVGLANFDARPPLQVSTMSEKKSETSQVLSAV